MGRFVAVAAAVASSAMLAAASGAETLERVRARLETHPVVRAEFVQTRRIAALSKPIVTRGRMLVSRADGVVWQVEHPFRVTYVITQDAMIEISQDGRRTHSGEPEAPASARVARLVRALTGGDIEGLDRWFEVDASGEGARWRIALKPIGSQFARHLKAVRLSGSEFVEEVDVDAVNGDQTELHFRNHRSGALSEEERRLFTGG